MHHEVEPPHSHHGSATLLDRIVSAAAILVALSSLGIAVYEARMTREHDKVSVWPYITAFNSDSGGVYTFNVANAGIGPALVRSFQVRVDGKRQGNWGEALETLVGPLDRIPSVYSSFGRGTVLLPGNKLALLKISGSMSQRVHAAVQRRMTVRICYCSLYEDCWTLDDSREEEPHPTGGCSRDTTSEFAR